MVESLVHGATNPDAHAALSQDGARAEAIRTVMGYVSSFRRSATKRY